MKGHKGHAQGQRPPRGGRLLVIDDDRLLATAIERTLNVEHYVVCTASAEAALTIMAAGERFDLIICDIMMPDMNGMDFHAELLRAYPEQAERIIFLTGGGYTHRLRAFCDEIPNLLLEKPFSPSQLRALVNARIGGGG